MEGKKLRKKIVSGIANLVTQGASFGVDLLPTKRLRMTSRKGLEYYRERFGLEPLTYIEIPRPHKGEVRLEKFAGLELRKKK